jgi:cytochrome P450/NADPH-cytochrome P450 reductase
MLDVADQLVDKWARLNPGEEVDVAADMTRLTLDTIALCGFGYRFNSFYRESPHPFVDAMVRTLAESQARARQLPIQTRLRVRAQRQFEEDEAFMNDLVDGIIAERRAEGAAGDTTDLLGRMLTGVDKDGEHLPDENIRAQCITFLIAGHETTSGLLSFAVYYLMKNPDVLARARAEVDEVFGATAAPTFDQVHRLRYVRQILDETLRLWPTAPGFNRTPFEDTVIGGKYAVAAGTAITVISQALHHSTEVWGPDAKEFNPDHTAAERMTAIPPNAYKPFGTGQRACIGRQFAIQEAVLVLGMLVQRFDFVDHLDYELKTKTTLTVKPDELLIQVHQHGRPRLTQHVRQLVAAVEEVDRDRGGAGAGDRELAGDELRVVRHLEPDVLTGPYARRDQAARKAQRPVPELSVAVGGLVSDQIRAVRPARGGGVERFVQRVWHPRRVPGLQGRAALGQGRQPVCGNGCHVAIPSVVGVIPW